jgi:ferredoxin
MAARDHLFKPRSDRAAVITKLLAARRDGATLREAATAAGVNVATVCRWQLRCPELAAALEAAHSAACSAAAQHRAAPPPRIDKFSVPCHPQCPKCGAPAQIARTASGRLYFWKCTREQTCP